MLSADATPYNPAAPTGGGYATNAVTQGPMLPTSQELPIFAGYAPSHPDDVRAGLAPSAPDELAPTKQPTFGFASNFLDKFDSFSHEDFLKFRNLFIAAGLVSEGASPMTVRDAFTSLLSMMGEMTARGITISPMGYVKNLIRMNGLDPSKVPATEDYSLKETKPLDPWTKTQKTVYDLSPEDARATLEDAMTAKLGRAPTEDEIHDFINAAQTAARKNPTTATATFTPGDTGLKGESSTEVTKNGVTTQTDANGTTIIHQSDGFTAEDVSRLAEERAKQAPDYADYQAVATYFPALQAMLGATAG